MSLECLRIVLSLCANVFQLKLPCDSNYDSNHTHDMLSWIALKSIDLPRLRTIEFYQSLNDWSTANVLNRYPSLEVCRIFADPDRYEKTISIPQLRKFLHRKNLKIIQEEINDNSMETYMMLDGIYD